MYTLHREQILDTNIDKAWDFIKNPRNLNRITPDNLHFTIISDLPDEMYNGLLIEYRVKLPLLGTRPWISEIKHIRPPYAFVDEQRIGPYKLWYHYHEIEQMENGVKMIDRVYYDMPFSLFGTLAHALIVKKKLAYIFDYRQQKLDEIF